MKSTLEFNLPEEKEELQAALNGSLYKARIDELYDRVFRPHIKYGKPILKSKKGSDLELTSQQLAVIQQLWENVRQHFEDVV
jgi:hypothetical protein